MGTTIRIGTRGNGGGSDQPPPPDPPPDDVAATAPIAATVPIAPITAAADTQVTIPIAVGRPRCPVCGERFSRGSRFCAFDGTRLADAPEESSDDPLVGQVLAGKYTVLRPIGEGGMGTVYEVRHSALDRRFALKVLRPEIAQNAEHLQRFVLEAKAAAAIEHPGLVSVSDFGECEIRGRRVPFFVMEFLSGTSLAALLKKEKTLPPQRCARVLAACAEALAAAHAAGVIHRDLKPDNIFLTGDSGDVVKVLDFGVAKMQSVAKRLTKVGMVFGTPHYMSPEQAGGKTIDNRADIYALGVILYECLAGRVPFEADSSSGVLTKQLFADPEPIERVMPDARGLGALGPIVMRCLQKEPDDRFASMDELAAALHQALADPVAAANEALGGGSGRQRRPHLRLREDMTVPRSVHPPADEPAPRDWTRLAAFAAAGVAVLALVAVSARALFQASSTSVASAPSASGVSTSTSGSTAAISAAASPPSPTAPSAAATASSDVAPSPSAVAAASSLSSPAASSPSSPTAARTSVPPSSTKKQQGGTAVIDPWSTPKKQQPPPPPPVLDPWSPKK